MQSNNINTYEEIIRIPTGEVEPLTVLRPSGILDCFQTVAGIHATVLGLGLRRLLENNHAWVLVRTKYDVYKQIPKESQVIVETWPHVKGAFDYDREYRILDLDIKESSLNIRLLPNGRCHDRYIIIDYNTPNEKIYLSGASSKDAGNRISTISTLSENAIYKPLIENLLKNHELVL